MVKRRGVKSESKQPKGNSAAKKAVAASTSKDVLPHGVTRTEVLEEPVPVEMATEEPYLNEDGNLVVGGKVWERMGEDEAPPVAAETKPKATRTRKKTTTKKTVKKVAKSKKTEPKTVAKSETKAKPVPNGTFVPPHELYDEEDYQTFVELAESYISAQSNLSIFMQEHDDRAYKMLNKVSPNFVRSLIDRRAPQGE